MLNPGYLSKMKKGKNSPSWNVKMLKPAAPEIVEAPAMWMKGKTGGKMLIPTPVMIRNIVAKIPKGKLMTSSVLRERMAAGIGADITCPMTTGIFLSIAAHAAEEDKAEGKKRIMPYWRLVKDGGKLNPKYPGGCEQHAAYLEAEGFEIIKGKGKDSYAVKDYEKMAVV